MRFRIPAMILLALAFAGSAAAQDAGSLNSFRNHALPVLVQVDAHGRVTQMQPAVTLRPNMRKLLRQTLEQMITGPAKEHGRPISSQFVIQLALKTNKQADGRYKAWFAYVSSTPVPMGAMYWARSGDDGQLALVSAHIGGSAAIMRGGMRVDDRRYHWLNASGQRQSGASSRSPSVSALPAGIRYSGYSGAMGTSTGSSNAASAHHKH